MDTSETYIKMCNCEEIQGQWKPNKIDFAPYYSLAIPMNIPRKSRVWLPRQDQLQEMVGEEYPIDLLYGFHRFYNTMGCDLYPHTINGAKTSMEQLWLAFVMKEKYNKVWYGSDWIDSY